MGGEPNQVLWRGVQPVSGIQGIWPAIDSVRVNKTASRTDSGTELIYTVPSGKILFISTAALTSRYTGAAGVAASIWVRNDSDVKQYMLPNHYYQAAGQLFGSTPFCPALEALADWDVVVEVVGADLYARGFIHGWLEDA